MENLGQQAENQAGKIDPSTKLIFVCDDDDSIVELLEYILKREGFKVETATNGKDALVKIKSLVPDLIVTDAVLPMLTGYELVRSLQSNINLKKIPIIIITAKFKDPNVERMFIYEPNVKDYIVKPVQPDYLVNKIHKILNTKPKHELIAEEKVKEFKKKFEEI